MTQNFPHIIPVYKWEGETPLDCIKRIQEAYPHYKDYPMTYAGRLDPMAHGLLVLLAGDKCKQKEDYLVLDKTYIVDIVFGISTDTGDVLGVVKACTQAGLGWSSDLEHILRGFIGKQTQKYPIFSSKTVHGKPLFTYAKEGRVNEITLPKHEITIFSIDIEKTGTISCGVLKNKAIERISVIEGDFRQDTCISCWKDVQGDDFSVIRLKIRASSGSYMRQLAHDIGEKTGIPAFAWGIYRSSVGDFRLLTNDS